ncbi:unnamed protein product [Paramecium octaurelia]|uniref:Insulin-like growth factor binding protein, N-terminal n=1 Tax=Paramecium octaurelia TaxID=43137 RepID=A0A8S1YPH9_PAROT|nr:unnamed protein product [Paramecium octaurelia]
MIILFIIISTIHQTVIYEFNAISNIIDNEWQNNQNFAQIQTCGGIQYYGASGYSYISRIFLNLEPHSHFIIDAQFLSIDSNYQTFIQLDSWTQNSDPLISPQGSICNDVQIENIRSYSITYKHNRGSFWIYFRSHNGGLMSLKLTMIKCQYESAACIDNYHIIGLKWKAHQYSLNGKDVTQSEGWTFQLNYWTNFYCGNCKFLKFLKVKYQTELPPHQDVLIRFLKSGYQTTIEVDYQYDKQTFSNCYYIEILIRNYRNPILQLVLQSPINLEYNQIRDFEVFYTELEIKFKNLNEGCLEQINDNCLICQEGWTSEEFLEKCHPICGDGIIQGQEECDNLISNHSCQQCKYSCIENCQICQFGICLSCVEGFVINANLNCDPLCGDGNLIPYTVEECELTVNGVWDGCQDCRSIPIANCKTNHLSFCLEWELGFYMLENVCSPYCGDRLILQQYEDCDDGNFQPYDGCYQCKFQCIEDCNICDRGQCTLKCEDGYKFANNDCLSVCGDQIVTKEEECDDGNTIKFDGCFLCKYSCPENCYDCYQGTCLECYDQYQLLNSNQCQKQLHCGDGQLQEQEECDDGNTNAFDGCKGCLIEQNWVCITMTKNSPSQCAFVKAPSFFINYLNMTSNKQYISIQFNQQVKIYTAQPLSETLNFELLDIDKKQWNCSLFIIQDVGSYLSFGEYIVEIEVYQLLKFRPILKILVNQKVANADNAVLDDFEKQITLQYPNYINDMQKDYSYSLKSLNLHLIYILSGITIISLLFGSADLFVEILAILQFQQYLRYINLQFPENLDIYFSLNNLITVQPLLEFVYFPQFLQLIDIEADQEYSDGKFIVYKQNSSLIINLSCQIFQSIIFLFVILFHHWIKRVLLLHVIAIIIYKSKNYFQNQLNMLQFWP